jgi:hypothetical protein
MTEVEIRLAWVIGAVLVGVVITVLLRQRSPRHRPRAIFQTGLSAGVYLFTSASCPDCEAARNALLTTLGPGGYSEMTWDADPEIFLELGVDAVPATLIVSPSDGSMLYPGRPDRALEVLSP